MSGRKLGQALPAEDKRVILFNYDQLLKGKSRMEKGLRDKFLHHFGISKTTLYRLLGERKQKGKKNAKHVVR